MVRSLIGGGGGKVERGEVWRDCYIGRWWWWKKGERDGEVVGKVRSWRGGEVS